MREYKHNDQAVCRRCDDVIQFVQYTQWNGHAHDILDEWWSHRGPSPRDGHDAEPVEFDDVLGEERA